jgi:hypothetical protein
MKNKKQLEHIQNYDMDIIIENQNGNKQWIHMLNDLHRKKFDTPMLKLENPYCSKKNMHMEMIIHNNLEYVNYSMSKHK